MLRLAMALKLKGLAPVDRLAGAAGLSPEGVTTGLEDLQREGRVDETSRGYRLTPEGQAWVAGLLADERKRLDEAAIDANYERFCEHNGAVKQVVTDWQMRVVDGEQVINDHTDPAYDARIIARLGTLHDQVRPVLDEAVRLCPRLDHYLARFDTALARIGVGDGSWLASPLQDSYHTVWFELHEELILLAGRSRADEAAAGRGA